GVASALSGRGAVGASGSRREAGGGPAETRCDVLGADRLTHWSLPVKNLAESEAFFGDFLGFEYRGPLGGPLATVSHASVFRVGESSFILWETGFEADPRLAEVGVHY